MKIIGKSLFLSKKLHWLEYFPNLPAISVYNNMQKAANCMFDVSHARTCLVMLRKVGQDSSTLCNLKTNILQHCRLPKWGDFIKAQGALVW